MYKERATGLILPDGVKTGRALRQEAAERAVISAINSGYSHYGASRTKANVRGWNSYSGSAKEDIEDNLDLLRQRSRDAYMGIPSATAALKTLRTNVIAGGLMPSPQIDGDYLKMTSGQVEDLQAQILRDAYYPKGHIPKPAEPQHLRENNRRPTPGPLFFHTCKRPTADRSKNPMARRPSKRRQFPRVPASPISPA